MTKGVLGDVTDVTLLPMLKGAVMIYRRATHFRGFHGLTFINPQKLHWYSYS